MFKNLRAEMAREALSGKEIADGIGITAQCFYDKATGKTEFKRSEMISIRRKFFTDKTLEYLFEFDCEKVN